MLESSENGKLLWNILHNTQRPLKDDGTSGGGGASGIGLLHKSSLSTRFRRGALLSAVASASSARKGPQRSTRQPRKN